MGKINILETPENLIERMKKKNIKFNIMTEENAIHFLEHNTYYKKITSYESNFHYSIKEGKKIYSNLDFAYLVELSRIDMEFRFIVIQMCLNIEHALKVKAINICLDNKEDGYAIVEEYFNSQNEDVKGKILKNANNSYCMDLVLQNQNKLPLWVMLEVVSFGDLCHFYQFLSKKGYVNCSELDVIFKIRDLRNAAAHNHCLLSQIKSGDAKPIAKISQYVSGNDTIGRQERKNRLSSRCINDFVTLLYAFEYYIESEGIIKHTKEEVEKLFVERMLKHKEYFSDCLTVKNAYSFVKKVIDMWM